MYLPFVFLSHFDASAQREGKRHDEKEVGDADKQKTPKVKFVIRIWTKQI